MQPFTGTQMTSAVLGDRELCSCLLFWPSVVLLIVSNQHGECLKAAQRQREWLREAKRGGEREFAHGPGCLDQFFCFHQRQPRLSWETLTDSSLYASLLCDSYHTTETSALCSSAPSYSQGRKCIFPFCIQTRVCHSPHVWRRNANH